VKLDSTTTMRVAFDARSLANPALRGWDRYTVGLVRELTRLGVDVTLFSRARMPLHEEHVRSLGCTIQPLEDWGGFYWEQMAVPLALWRGKYDIFHAPAEHGLPMLAPCPVVMTIHSVTDYSYEALVRNGTLPGRTRDYTGREITRRSWRSYYWHAQVARASHLIAPSEFTRDEITKYLRVPRERITVTPLAVDEQFKRPPRDAEARQQTLRRLGVAGSYLLYVGGYERHKNIAGLLETFARVKSAMPDRSLVMVGSKFLPSELERVAAGVGLDVGRDVVFLVNLGEDLTDLYDGAELFVTLSWRESFCLPVIEAMTRGVPVVASSWGASREVVGDAGCLVDPRSHAEAADAIIATLKTADRALRSERARLRAQRFASWRQAAASTIEVYELLSGKKLCPQATTAR
jgi:glycosyltransferase involved in cell wall biosynthesis